MIKKLKMWRNPGYTEECIEIPPIGSRKLPAPDWVNTKNGQFYDLRPRKDSTLSKIELPLSFSATWDMSYLWMQAEDDAGNIEVFGWIRSVEQIAGSEEAVRIMWVPDYWRTCSGSVSFGKGIITKTDESSYARPIRIQPRKWDVKTRRKLAYTDDETLYNTVLLAHTIKTGDTVTEIQYLWWNLGTANTPTLEDVYRGKVDEKLGIDPESITGMWLCPMDPGSYAGTYTHGTIQVIIAGNTTLGSVTELFDNAVTTDDTHRIVISDYMGAILGEVPYGYTVSGWKCVLDYGVNQCNVVVDIITTDGSEGEEGLRMTLPCYELPITSNAWSSYVYSGQREYDMQMRVINRNQKAVNSLASTATSNTVGGGILGSLLGKTGVGAAAGLATSIIGTAIDYGTTMIFDDQLQQATDKLYSNQTSNIIQPAGGIAWKYVNNQTYNVCVMEPDAVSKAELTAFVINQGYDVEIPVGAASGFMTGGPVQIRNLNVTGSVPPAAKTAIKAKLEAGVFIVENNPTGTDPAI